MKNKIEKNSAYSFFIVFFVIAIVVLCNVLLSVINNKTPLEIDLTKNKFYNLQNETKNALDIIKKQNKNIIIYVLNSESNFIKETPREYFMQANEIIKKIALEGKGVIELSYIDIVRNPSFKTQYPDFDLRLNDILITAGSKKFHLESADLFNIKTDGGRAYIASSRAESAVLGAIQKVISEKETNAVFITGHNEDDTSGFEKFLYKNNFSVSRVNLLTEEINVTSNLLVMAAPSRDLSEAELNKIDAFLESGNNKTFFYLAGLNQGDIPNINAFLGEWGIAVDDGIIFQTDNARIIGNSPYISFLDYAEDNFSKRAASRGIRAVTPLSHPVSLLWENRDYKKTEPLLLSGEGSGARPSTADDNFTPSARNLLPNALSLALSRETRNAPNNALRRSAVVVSGSVQAVNETVLSSGNIANASYFLDLFDALCETDAPFRVPDKTQDAYSANLTLDQVMFLTIIFGGILPFLVTACGVIVFFKRRNM